MTNYPGKQFGLFRICLGLYLLVHLTLASMHYSDFLWPLLMTPEPITPAPYWLFPLGSLLSLLFLAGTLRRISAIGLWIILRILVYKNIFYYGMNLDYVGFLLILSLFVPSGEPWSLTKNNPNWKMPNEVYWGAWIVFTLSMTISGLNKILISPEWRSGDTLRILLTDSAAYYFENIKLLALQFPLGMKVITWMTLVVETVSIAALLKQSFRFYYSVLTFFIFLFTALFVVMREIAICVLIFELLLFDFDFYRKKWHEKTIL